MLFLYYLFCCFGFSFGIKTILIVLDGLTEHHLRNMSHLLTLSSQETAHHCSLQPVFPASTYPNMASLITGNFTNSHKVNDSNTFWEKAKVIGTLWDYNRDSKTNKSYSRFINWPEFSNHTDFIVSEKPMDTLQELLTKESITFISLYFNSPGNSAKIFGPNSTNVQKDIQELDKMLFQLDSKILSHYLDINMVIVSLPPYVPVSLNNIITLNKFVETQLFKAFGKSPVLHVIPKEDKQIDVYERLKMTNSENLFQVYYKGNLPMNWHYSSKSKEIIVVAHEGKAFSDFFELVHGYNSESNLSQDLDRLYGLNGYDNRLPSMQSLLFVKGPSFVKSSTTPLKNIVMVDVFSLLAYILDLNELHDCKEGSVYKFNSILLISPNSSFKQFQDFLNYILSPKHLPFTVAICVLFLLLCMGLCIIIFCHKRWTYSNANNYKYTQISYKTLHNLTDTIIS